MILEEDLEYISSKFGDNQTFFNNSNIVILGGAGFLGYYFVNYFNFLKKREEIDLNLTVVDNFILRKPVWVSELEQESEVDFLSIDISKASLKEINKLGDLDYIIHMASIASPTYYRKFPMKTMEANVFGLKKIIDFYKDKNIKGMLYFSSSEVYGDPDPENIPTKENYNGNVASIGPRACYDESKRFSETLCYVASEIYEFPVKIVRPFNNFGPGMYLDDKRVPADFARNVVDNTDIVILSDGSPSRTFCYISDAIVGYLKALTYSSFDFFNIGIDYPEISIKELANIYLEKGADIFDYTGTIRFKSSKEDNYLVDNPQRRCPDITKAKKLLNYNPEIAVKDGVERYLKFLKEDTERWSES